ncbi:50S ribosomal protein L18 [Candidatus Parcubacteria bacterium]|nr:50S ribosomal protein L18 [Candidatus Parcubacteria bacterium]
MLKKQEKRVRRHKKVRAKIFGTGSVPRLCVFRSSRHIYAQVIDDEKGKVISSTSDFEIKESKLEKSKIKNQKSKIQIKNQKLKEGEKKEEKSRTGKVAIAYEVGKLIAEKVLEKKIKKVLFDRGGYKYHGRVKAVAEGARNAGLVF